MKINFLLDKKLILLYSNIFVYQNNIYLDNNAK
jgi:hypothetical protein